MKRVLFSFVFLSLATAFVLIPARHIHAQSTSTAPVTSPATISYPVSALGNCSSKSDCKTYCDDASHVQACLDFAEQHNLMSPNDVAIAKKFIAADTQGPGGCTDQQSCEAYCNDIGHINECVAFAKKTGILPPDKLQQAEQIQSALAKGVQPPPCKNKEECDTYCSEPAHMHVCVAFGEAAGFLRGQDLENAKKMVAAIDAGATPPPCNGKDACDAYCAEPAHMATCITFAKQAGLMTPEEEKNSQGVLTALQKGVTPPNCKGKDACDAYCAEPAHFDECTNFAVAAGFMTPEDAAIAKKTGGKGPGGCTSKESCDAFCKDPNNQEACFNFAKDNGLISQQDLQNMQSQQGQMQKSLQNIPPDVLTCLNNTIGADTLQKLQSGSIMPSSDIGKKMSQCFPQMPQQNAHQQESGGSNTPFMNGPQQQRMNGPQEMPHSGQQQTMIPPFHGNSDQNGNRMPNQLNRNTMPSQDGMIPQEHYPQQQGSMPPQEGNQQFMPQGGPQGNQPSETPYTNQEQQGSFPPQNTNIQMPPQNIMSPQGGEENALPGTLSAPPLPTPENTPQMPQTMMPQNTPASQPSPQASLYRQSPFAFLFELITHSLIH
ncbi:MAG: hypothetical protein KGI50_01685 [Patescibacteria group bacterium]|nr:hypothetical protein [Patescibacteria group bacterium]MDE2437945.1 hypothetical protein [Patescibacteria group bacterium]